MSSLANTTLSFKSFCKVDFNGGDLSSNCGLLPMGQFMDNMGITSFLKENFFDGSHRLKRHNDADILLQLIYQNLGGYFTDDSADHLAYEPIILDIYIQTDALALIGRLDGLFIFQIADSLPVSGMYTNSSSRQSHHILAFHNSANKAATPAESTKIGNRP